MIRSPDFFRHHDRFRLFQRFAGRGWNRDQQGLFAIDEVAGIEGRQLEAVAVRDGICWASLNAIAAKNTAVVVDVIDLGVALSAADAVLFRVLSSLNINAVGRARSSAEEAGHTLL